MGRCSKLNINDQYNYRVLTVRNGPFIFSLLSLMNSSYDEICKGHWDTLYDHTVHMWTSDRHISCYGCIRRCIISGTVQTVPHEFGSLEERLEHFIAAHHPCHICSTPENIKNFGSEGSFMDHMERHFACVHCNHQTTFKSYSEWKEHLLKFHHACLLCRGWGITIKFDNEAILLSHMEDSHHACVFGCKDPDFGNDRVFGSDKSLRQHYIKHHHGCHFCLIRNFHSKRERDQHHKQEHPDSQSERPQKPSPKPKPKNAFHCKSCSDNLAGFSQHEDLLSHRRKHHGVVFCSDPTCVRPTLINWPRWQHDHMEFCHHPNPCNDFSSKTLNDNCPICHEPCRTSAFMLRHFQSKHPCAECNEHIAHYFSIQTEHATRHHEPKPKPKPHNSPSSSSPPKPLDIYAILELPPHSSHEEIKRIAKRRRIETHPDRLVKEGMGETEKAAIDEKAKLVGWAADVVCDGARRERYDEEVRIWMRDYGGL